MVVGIGIVGILAVLTAAVLLIIESFASLRILKTHDHR